MRAMVVVVATVLAAPASADAQMPSTEAPASLGAPRQGGGTAIDRHVARVDVEVGGGLFGGADLDTTDATLRANAQSRQPFRLFTADSRFARAGSVHVRASVPLGRRVGIEGGVTWGRPEIRVALSADAEGAAPLTSVERVHQYIFDASLVWMVDALRLGERLVPFVSGGAGYLRHLHEGRTLIEHGQTYHAGGGLKYWLLTRPRGVVRSTGLRGDVRVQVLRGGIGFEDRPRPHAAVSGGLFVGF